MSDFTSNPWISNPFDNEVWQSNPWGADDGSLYFTNTGVSLSPYITVTGTPDILWTWSDGSTSTVANPGAKFLTGTPKLLVTPWSAVWDFYFNAESLIDPFVLRNWTGMTRLQIENNSFSGNFVSYPWESVLNIYIYGNNYTGILKLLTWDTVQRLHFRDNSFSSISGSFQTQIKLVNLNLQGNNISSQSEIDLIYEDLLINAAATGRTNICIVFTDGANMSAPSAAGLSDIDDLVNIYGWTVTHA